MAGHGVGARVVRRRVGQRIGYLFAVAVPKTTHHVMPGDRVEPRAQFLGFAEISEVCRGDAEGVLNTVGRSVTVSEQPNAEVVKAIGITVIYFGERATITLCGGTRQHGVGGGIRHITVPGVGQQWQNSGHKVFSPGRSQRMASS